MKSLDTERVLHIITYYMHRINNKVRRLDRLCAQAGMPFPEPPESLTYREVDGGKRERVWVCSAFERRDSHLYPARFSVWYSDKPTERERRDHRYYSIGNDSGAYDSDSPPAPESFTEYSSERKIAALIARCRVRTLPALIQHFESVLEWLDRVERAMQRHVEHVQQQFRSGKRYRRIQQALTEVEDYLVLGSL